MKKKTFIKEGAYQKIDNIKGKTIKGALDLSKEILDVLVDKGVITTEDCCTYEVAGGSSYLVYTALLTQTGTDAPVATVLENTLGGTVVWTYFGPGQYDATLSGVFTNNKTLIFISALNTTAYPNSTSVVRVTCNLGDGIFDLTPIEIRVYP